MDLYQLILKRRSVRRFKQKEIPLRILKKIINAARLAPSAGNLQFIEYIIVKDKEMREVIFPYTKWAAYIHPLGIPKENDRPTCFIAVVINYKKSSHPDLRDIGAGVENLLLSSLNFGVATCWLGAIEKEAISKILNLPSYCALDSLVALGYPAEEPVVVDNEKEIKYWRNEAGKHFVPKRPLEKILYLNRYGNRD